MLSNVYVFLSFQKNGVSDGKCLHYWWKPDIFFIKSISGNVKHLGNEKLSKTLVNWYINTYQFTKTWFCSNIFVPTHENSITNTVFISINCWKINFALEHKNLKIPWSWYMSNMATMWYEKNLFFELSELNKVPICISIISV